MTTPTPESLAQSLYYINGQLAAVQSDITNKNLSGALSIITQLLDPNGDPSKSLYTQLISLEDLLSNTPPGPEQQALYTVIQTLHVAEADMLAAQGDLQNKNGAAALQQLQQSPSGGAVNDILGGFIMANFQWAVAQINDASTNNDTATMSAEVTALYNYLNDGFSSTLQWTALGISQTQYNQMMGSLQSAMNDLMATPPNTTKFATDWAAVTKIMGGSSLPPIGKS